MSKRPVGPVDNLWLGMDTPENLMVIDGVMWFSKPLDTDQAIALLDERLPGRYPVFRQHPVSTRDPRYHAKWKDDKNFDIRDHVFEVTLDAPGSQDQLQAYIDSVISLPLDTKRSPWEVHLIHGYGSGSAMYLRLHHAMADGTALARVILELTEDDPASSDATGPQLEAPASSVADKPHAEASSLTDQIVDSVGDLISGASRAGLSMFHHATELIDPRNFMDVSPLVPSTGESSAKLLGTTLPDTALSGKVDIPKNARWSDPIPLAKVKQVAHAHDATVNDVLVSILAGAMARYLETQGQQPIDVSTMVPVNLRPLDQPLPRELGNKFALVMLSLPLSVQAPLDRLAETKRRMDKIKESSEAVLTFGLISSFGSFSPGAARYMIDFFSNKAVGITTNVPGPQTSRVFAGIPVSGVVGWAPGAGTQSVNACIFSLSGEITVGFKTDAAVITEPELLLSSFTAEYEALLSTKPD